MKAWLRALYVSVVFCAGAHTSALAATDYFSAYPYAAPADGVDLGVQPMAYPIAFISSVMQRDRLLQKALAKRTTFHPFRKGNDMVAQVGAGKLEGALLGDMPTINTLVHTPSVIVGLAKKNFSTVVARDYTRFEQLRGKRVAYSPGSSSHYTLLQGLHAAGMTEGDVRLVALEPSVMPMALANKEIDAFSAWEPTPSIALSQDKNNRAIYKSISSDWFVLSREFVEQQPKPALQIVAAYVRAINWLRASRGNVDTAVQWVFADGAKFTGEPLPLKASQAAGILRKDLLDVPGAPVVTNLKNDVLPLSGELAFLKTLGKVSASVGDDLLRDAFAYKGLKKVLADPQKYQIYAFDYVD